MQFLYLEHNALRCLPPGPYWRHLNVLSTDWEPLLRSHQLLHEVSAALQCCLLWFGCAYALPFCCSSPWFNSNTTQFTPNICMWLLFRRHLGYASWLLGACQSSECLSLHRRLFLLTGRPPPTAGLFCQRCNAWSPHPLPVPTCSPSLLFPAALPLDHSTHMADGLPPLAPVESLLASLRSHGGLAKILLVVRPAHVHGVSQLCCAGLQRAHQCTCALCRPACCCACHVTVPSQRLRSHGLCLCLCCSRPCRALLQAVSVVLEAMLQLRGLRAGLEVRPIEHDAFFVEEPPEEEGGQEAGGGQQGQGGAAADTNAT